MNKRDKRAEDNFFKRQQQKKPVKWENLLSKCKKCGSTNLERLNLFQGMHKKNSMGNYQMVRCKDCGGEEWVML